MNRFGTSVLLAAGLLLVACAAGAANRLAAVPAGEPMSPNPVAPQSELQEKHGTFGGVERTWYEYVPRSHDGKNRVPLVVALHGGNADGVWMFGATSWAQIADQLGFIVIYPNGSIGADRKLRWNGYAEFNKSPAMAMSADNGVDEARFLDELIATTVQRYRIDSSRVYMHGQSNGGMMTSYFGLRYPQRLAAMAVTSAPPSIEVMGAYPGGVPLPTYFWSGETDTVAGQYNPANKSRPVLNQEFAEFWARRNRVAQQPVLHLDGPYNTKIYAGRAEVRNTEFRNGVHSLPFTAAYVIWNDFFSRFARGRSGKVVRGVADPAQAAPGTGAVSIKPGVASSLVDNRVSDAQ